MRNFKKILVIFTAILIFTAIPVFSLDGLDDLQENVNNFTKSMANSLPFNSTMGLNWSDAYIGRFIAIPPHIGVGVTTGFTTMDFGSINQLLEMFNVPLPIDVNLGGLPLPGYTADARIGGILIPFDVGVKFGLLNIEKGFWDFFKIDNVDFTMNYRLIGFDLRYALLGSKKSPLKISLGAGFNWMDGGISMPIPDVVPLSFKFGNYTIDLPSPGLGLNWSARSLDFKIQASVKVLILTPYIGFGATHAWSRAGYGLTTEENIKINGDDIDLEDIAIMDELKDYGLAGITSRGFEHYDEVKGWSFRAFGGFSINVTFLRFDITGMYDFLSKNYGVTFGTRFQL